MKVLTHPRPAGLRLNQPRPGQQHHSEGGGGRGGVAPLREAAALDERSQGSPSSIDGRDVGDQINPGQHQAAVGEIIPGHSGGSREQSQ